MHNFNSKIRISFFHFIVLLDEDFVVFLPSKIDAELFDYG